MMAEEEPRPPIGPVPIFKVGRYRELVATHSESTAHRLSVTLWLEGAFTAF